MIGPRAYEDLFQTKHSEWKEVHVEVEERGGMYADSIEVIENE